MPISPRLAATLCLSHSPLPVQASFTRRIRASRHGGRAGSARVAAVLAALVMASAALTPAPVAAQAARQSAAQGRWVPASPFGGLVGALAEAPSAPGIVYAGTDPAGVFRSSDGGMSERFDARDRSLDPGPSPRRRPGSRPGLRPQRRDSAQ
jgi:hypothetical protein